MKSMCGPRPDFMQENREIRYHLTRALRLYQRVIEGESGEVFSVPELVDGMCADLKGNNDIGLDFARFTEGLCLECGKPIDKTISLDENLSLCNECLSSG